MQAHNSVGWSSVSITLYFQTSSSTQPPTLILPPNGSHQTSSISFQWNSVSGATNYELSLKFPGSSSWLTDYTTSTNYPYSPTLLGEFHWKVRAYLNGNWSDYSSEWLFYFDGLPAPSLISPSNGSEITDIRPTFQWSSVTGSNYYGLQLSRNSSFTDMVRDNLTIYGTSWQLDNQDLTNGQTYYWRIRSNSPIGQWSNYWSFNIQQQETVSTPNTPTCPSGGKVGQSLTFYIDGSNSNLGHTVEYQIDWGDGTQSDWGSSSQTHSYSSSGTKTIKAHAHCQTHTGVVSGWSSTSSVLISYCTLTINVSPSGSGSVSKNPDKTEFSYNETVQLTANANSGYKFDHWGGDASGTQNPLTVTMDANKTITANFAINMYSLTVNATNGTVTKNPDQSSYNHGTSVELTATPVTGYHFTNWSGDASGIQNPLTVTMDARKTITANFAINMYSLTVNATNGTVTKNPDQAIYNHGTSVELTATPVIGYHFANWSGDVSGTQNPLTVTMDANKTITANFAINMYSLTVNATNGTVTKNPDQAIYDHGTSVQLTATPSTDYHFVNWSGDASGTESPLTIVMDGNKTITADFAINLPGKVSLVSPFNLANIQSDSVILVWNQSQPQVFRYWIEWSVDSVFSSPFIDTTITDTVKIIRQLNNNQTYWWWVKAMNDAGAGPFSQSRSFSVSLSGIREELIIPTKFALNQNFPNPFNPVTTICYALPKSARVELFVYDLNGRIVEKLVNEWKTPGYYSVQWDAEHYPSGVYFYHIQAGDFTETRKCLLIK